MKNTLMIATLAFIVSCSGTKEVYDDTYVAAEKPEVVEENDDLGYADYIKNQEDEYDVEVDSSQSYDNSRTSSGSNLGGSYYADNMTVNNYYNNNGGFSNGYGNNGWGGNTYNYYGNNYGWGNSYWGGWNYGYGYYSSGWSWTWGSYYRPWYHHHHHCWGSPYYGWNNNPWYGGYGGGWFYDPYWGWTPSWGGYYGNGWATPYSNSGFTSGGDFVAGSGNNNTFYGHRGNVNTGTSNSSNYTHTIMSKVDPGSKEKPFPTYSEKTKKTIKPLGTVSASSNGENTISGFKPVKNTTTVKGTTMDINARNEKPAVEKFANGGNAQMTERPNSGLHNRPSNASTNQFAVKNKPAVNKFSTERNKPVSTHTSKGTSRNTGNYTYKPSNSGNSGRNTTTKNGRNYSGNKYYRPTENRGTNTTRGNKRTYTRSTNKGSSNRSGNYNRGGSSNRSGNYNRSTRGSNRSSGTTNRSSGSSNRSSGSYRSSGSSNRSSSSGSSGNRSGGGSKGGSRRR